MASLRKALINGLATLDIEVPLNRYGFFEAFTSKLMPNSKVEIQIDRTSDNDLIWRTGRTPCVVVFTDMKLLVPRITFNGPGEKDYMENYLKEMQWI